jgi:hypothetical protein
MKKLKNLTMAFAILMAFAVSSCQDDTLQEVIDNTELNQPW